MISLCKEANLPAPEFAECAGGLEVTFKFAEPIAKSVKKHMTKPKLSPSQHEILKIIKKYRAVNIQQIMKELKEPPSRTMVKRDLDYMKKNGLVGIRGAARNAVWVLLEIDD